MEWAILEPLIPAPKPGGRPATVPRREIVSAILYVLGHAKRTLQTASSGGPCPTTCPTGPRSIPTSASGRRRGFGNG
ncbi:transposase [Meiothermus sp. Pnk-1]|uniref:transposase n=1 Tax=unclassified Meiothermus TaxID=370471 RepID=UPI003519FA0A